MTLPVATGAQMRDVDHTAIEERKIPGVVLMENAGRGISRSVRKYFGPLTGRNLSVVSGKGNNGGDGFVIARMLAEECGRIDVFVLADESSLKGDALENYRLIKKMDLHIHHISDISGFDDNMRLILSESFLIIDALLGTGISGEVKGFYGEAIELINSLEKIVVSVDIPSGLSSDTGKIDAPAVKADLTVALGLPKIAHYVFPASLFTGELEIADIGIPEDVVEKKEFNVHIIDKSDIEILFPERMADSHKGTYGHAVIIGGATGKAGAVVMAGKSAMRSGAGLVTAVVPSGINGVVQSSLIEAMSLPLQENKFGTLSAKAIDSIIEFCRGKSVVAAGPGMGANDETAEIVKMLIREIDVPLILDADAINVLARDVSILDKRKSDLILTPHPGEMGRLTGRTSSEIQKERFEICVETARRYACIVILKGRNSIISCRGERTYINLTGNPGMATGGSGDVLTGIIAGFVSQGLSAEYSACAGAFIHGLSGDIAAENLGEISLCAGDIIDYLPEAFQSCFYI